MIRINANECSTEAAIDDLGPKGMCVQSFTVREQWQQEQEDDTETAHG